MWYNIGTVKERGNEMEKTYTQKIHFKLVIEGDYSCGNLWEEELYKNIEDAYGNVWEYVSENIVDYYPNIELTNLETIEED